MTKLLFYIIIFILAAFVGLLVDHYLHSPGIWHCLMGIEFCGNGIFPERESRGLTLPIFPDGVPWDLNRLQTIGTDCFDSAQSIILDGVPLVAGIKCFWTESHGFKNAAENARESQDPPGPY
jgi:hypothetical protein